MIISLAVNSMNYDERLHPKIPNTNLNHPSMEVNFTDKTIQHVSVVISSRHTRDDVHTGYWTWALTEVLWGECPPHIVQQKDYR